jgi:hypothetical protein
MLEIPWPKWMEFVVLGISIIICGIILPVIDRFQRPSDD